MTDEQMQQIVGLIIARLQARPGNTAMLSAEALRHAPVQELVMAHDALHIGQATLPFLHQLAEGKCDDTAVANLFEALSLGMAVCIALPVQILAHLPLRGLAALPCCWCDPQGNKVTLHLKNVLS